MRFEELAGDVLMFVGDDHESVATAILDGEQALLIDALGSHDDARWLRRVLCEDLRKTVRVIVATHFMSDHMAGLSLFPDALTVAHRHHRYAFLSQNRRVDAFYREPRVVFDSAMNLRWGRHDLALIHNPGKTMDHISVDVPGADLVCVGDNIVGNIVYLSKADPALIRAAIGRIRQFGRGTVVGGHMGKFPADVLDNAVHYLDRLQHRVTKLRLDFAADEADARIASIPIEACLAPGVEACAFEREWHRRNLDVVIAQSVFAFDAALAARAVPA
ncbi:MULTISPECIES: MBL fold metallo-hydrolase [unclassified Lysobacter]|uniref:MBL fold metallo-hydrolase n=1 Tax=unclassified Lysobacter TaxID=2635362 RepID=UPI001BE61FCC|nr:MULTISPECIES: MBL fold metallo-hydrolase [unclassified Lysobacter]MBT2749198.1 MBL fold metallo-hydrolase [Lysobacter sp. ISL-42]MBT2754092.1 MBL fold metallo-hydrolase [Lysobacter sp. ISL-50]MBT2779463.1 MBL fold metallo-hydrolase [Lysobacter sp. ISL-54]MBT2781664.1 MBL fold metallo-hydrolase [Lysobacter sp. ISL-52]